MNTIFEILTLAGTLAGKLLTSEAQTRHQSALPQEVSGYTISVSPAVSVADGVSGEELYIKWETPLGAIALLDFINFYRVTTNGNDLVWFKQVLLRFGDSQFVFNEPGNYAVTYEHFSFFKYYTKASASVSVLPTRELVAQAKNYPPVGTNIIAFGDGLVNDPATASNLVYWLEVQTGLTIENSGKKGDTTTDALARLEIMTTEPEQKTLSHVVK